MKINKVIRKECILTEEEALLLYKILGEFSHEDDAKYKLSIDESCLLDTMYHDLDYAFEGLDKKDGEDN